MRTLFAGAALFAALVGSAQAEIRHMVCSISARQEVPASGTTARGCGQFTLDTDANTLTYRIVVFGLSTSETAAHIHGAADPGVNAGVKHTLPAGELKVGTWTYAEADEASILAGRTYVNVHTASFPGGECRGQIVDMVAELDGAQETPGNASTALGFGLFMINDAANTLTYYIKTDGVANETAAHIHGEANIGTAAGIVHPLPAGALKTGTWAFTDGLEQKIRDGVFYVNVHTVAFPGGEIRGQIVSSVNPMDKRQEVPATAQASAGCALCVIKRDTNSYGVDVRTLMTGTAETAAHIHGFAARGVNAGVKFGLPAGARKLAVWNYTDADEASILGGLTYVNVHTAANPGGEIRGQVEFIANPPPPPCPADFNGDGFLDFFDLDAYVSCFEGGACPPGKDADFNGDGFVDFFDSDAFVAAFEAGC